LKKFLINSKEKLFKIKRLVFEKIQDIKFDDYKEEMCLDIKVQIKNFIIKNK